jgi:DNA-binding MarR family transcriptional regulator
MKELAKSANITMGSVTQAIDILIAKKYLKRVRSQKDRRIVYAELATRGKKVYKTFRAFLLDAAEKLLSKFTPAEQRKITSIIAKIID